MINSFEENDTKRDHKQTFVLKFQLTFYQLAIITNISIATLDRKN